MTREEIQTVIDKGGWLLGSIGRHLSFVLKPDEIFLGRTGYMVRHKGSYWNDGDIFQNGVECIERFMREATEEEIKKYVK